MIFLQRSQTTICKLLIVFFLPMMSPFLMNGILSDEVENLGHIEAVAKQASIRTLTLGHMDTMKQDFSRVIHI